MKFQSLLQFQIFLTKLIVILSVEKRPVYYFDNGRDQSTAHHITSIEEKRNIESKILTMLDLKKRPEQIKHPLKKSAPRFLLNVYNKIASKEVDGDVRVKRSIDIDLHFEQLKEVYDSDLIMTFAVSGETKLADKSGKVFWIDVKKTVESDNILGAFLRLYKFPAKIGSREQEYTVNAFEISKEKPELNHVTSMNVTQEYTGWLSMNLTSCIHNWITTSQTSHGIYLNILQGNATQETSLEDIGIRYSTVEELRPFVVAFIKVDIHVNLRRARESNQNSTKSFANVINSYRSEHDNVRRCRMHTMYISFKDLNWQDWIIAPEGYAAHFCHGECRFPLSFDRNATNHAKIQSMVHLLNPERFPKPCCAPNALIPLSVLYFEDDNNVVLKKYKRMLVKSCGCH